MQINVKASKWLQQLSLSVCQRTLGRRTITQKNCSNKKNNQEVYKSNATWRGMEEWKTEHTRMPALVSWPLLSSWAISLRKTLSWLSRLFRSNFIRDVAIRNDVLLQQRENFKVNRMKKTGTGGFFFIRWFVKLVKNNAAAGESVNFKTPQNGSLSQTIHIQWKKFS